MQTQVVNSGRVLRAVILVLVLGAMVGCASAAGGDILTENLLEPLDGATTAKIDIDAGDATLTIDGLTGGEQLLAGGTLQYLESQGVPARTRVSFLEQATLTLEGGAAGRPRFRFPWAACSGATEWLIHLNPTVSSDITTHSDGGSVTLNLASMLVTRLSADTGGGNIDVVLPDNAVNLSVAANTSAGNVTIDIGGGTTGSNSVDASSGAGNVVVRIPSRIAARIHATARLGKVVVDPRFGKRDDGTYQSADFDSVANKIEITVKSGAGNTSVEAK